MAFVIAPKDTITLKVDIDEPQDMGRIKKHYLVVTYKKLPVDEARKIMEDVKADLVGDEDILERYVTDIKEARDEEGNEVPFTQDLVSLLAQIEYVRRPLIDGFMTVQFGREALRQKN